MARHRSNTRARQKPPESAGGMVTFVLVLIVGGGGAFFLKQYFDQKRNAEEREEMAYEEQKRNEMRDMIDRQKQLESQDSHPEEKEQRKLEISFDRDIVKVRSLLLQDAYGSALKILVGLNTGKLTDFQKQRVEALRQKIQTQAMEKFVKIKNRAAEKADREDYDGATLIVKKADVFGLPDISNEVNALALKYQKMKNLSKLGNQIQTFALIEDQLNPALSTFDHITARDTIESLTPVTDYMLFKDDLVGIKTDFYLIEKTWAKFKNAMSGRVGTVEMFGITRGTVKGIDDEGLTLDTPDGEVMLTLKEMQPAWIRAKAKITKEESPEAHYGLGVMFLHKGKEKDAREIFTQHMADEDKNAERHLRWLGWRNEVKALAVYNTLVSASQKKAVKRVPEIANEFKEKYGNTRLYDQESTKIQQMVDAAAEILAENKMKAKKIIAKLQTYEEEARVKLTEWFEEKKKIVEKQYQKELYDEFRYARRINSAYSKIRDGGNMRSNLDVVLRGVKRIRDREIEVSAARRKEIEKDKKYLQKGVRNASLNRESNANLAKRKRIQLSDNIKNERMRLVRRLQAGELVTDAVIGKKFNVFD